MYWDVFKIISFIFKFIIIVCSFFKQLVVFKITFYGCVVAYFVCVVLFWFVSDFFVYVMLYKHFDRWCREFSIFVLMLCFVFVSVSFVYVKNCLNISDMQGIRFFI